MQFLSAIFLIIFLSFTTACSGGGNDTSSPASPPVIPDPNPNPRPDPDPTPKPNPKPDMGHLNGGELTAEQKHVIDQRVLQSNVQPATGHPRLYGDNTAFFRKLTYIEQFDPGCTVSGVTKGLGQLPNMKRMWQGRMMGGVACLNTLDGDLSRHPDANKYWKDEVSASGWADNGKRIRVLHLLRRELFCENSGIPCRFDREQIQRLAAKMIAVEVQRLRDAPRVSQDPLYLDEMNVPAGYRFNYYWHKANSGAFMVLDAAPAFKFWTLLLDIFHENPLLNDVDRTFIEQELEYQIDSYLLQYKHQHWSLMNGNNWTVVLNSAALHWAILKFHEKPDKAKQVLKVVLETNWLHRDFYQPDGGYFEGGSYALSTSYPYILIQHKLLMAAFSQPMHGFKWGAGDTIASWLLDNFASDSYLVDFGDAHATQGISSGAILDLLMADKLLTHDYSAFSDVSSDSMVPDDTKACLFRRFFSNMYFDVIYDDPWSVSAFYFYDWEKIIDQCDVSLGGQRLDIYPVSGMTISEHVKASSDERDSLFEDNYQKQQLFMTSTATDVPHREMDIGGLIWSAYGNRLLSGFGYGRLVRNYYDYDLFTNFNGRYESHLDHVLGASTLILPEAFGQRTDINGDLRFEYIGQGHSGRADLTRKTMSGFNLVVMDATDAYGAPQVGKFARPAIEKRLGHFSRTLIQLGSYSLVLDSIASREGETTLAEDYFYVPYAHKEQGDPCAYPISDHVSLTLNHSLNDSNESHPQYVSLEPVCSHIERGKVSQVKARLYGYSLQPGGFTDDAPDYLNGVEPFSSDTLKTGENNESLIEMTNILNQRKKRQLFRWQPDEAINKDIRLFIFQAMKEDKQGVMPAATFVNVSDMNCGDEKVCWLLTIEGNRYQLDFVLKNNTLDSGNHFQLFDIKEPVK